MMNEEQSEIDVNTESSSETVEQTEQSTDSGQESVSQEASQQSQKPEEIPFHEHPRFKELISEKNQYRSEVQAYAKKMQELEARIAASTPQAQPQKDELMERLKGIDPVFAERFGKLNEVDQLKQELNEFRQWREQSAALQTQQSIQSTKESFYNENKVPADRKDLYEALVASTATANPNLQISDLPKVLKDVHEKIGKMFSTVERTTAKNFVDSKKADASKPAPLKKGAPAQSVSKESNMSRNDIREAIKAEALAEARANKNI
jgi:hypothetical protein